MPTDEKIKITIRLPRDLVKTAKHYCLDKELDLQDLVGQALIRFLQTKGVK
jgi:hypothetical protein